MKAEDNPEYLAATAAAVAGFRDALEGFLELHVVNTEIARGIAPAVYVIDGTDPAVLRAATMAVDEAAGRASAAAGLTRVLYNVQGTGTVDPIAVWHSITQPKPVLEPADILSACGQMIGRLNHMAAKAAAEAPPAIGAAAMHPLVWAAASRLWRDGHFRQAVAAAAEMLVSHVKVLTSRNDVSETSLWQQTFSAEPPEPAKPRLRWPGPPQDRDVKAMNEGLRQFSAGVQLTIRNDAAHSTAAMGEQDALERLAVLSVLARWVDACELVTAP